MEGEEDKEGNPELSIVPGARSSGGAATAPTGVGAAGITALYGLLFILSQRTRFLTQ